MREKKEFIEQGRITNTHGVKGEVKLEYWCDSEKDAARIKTVFLDPEGKKSLECEYSGKPYKGKGGVLFYCKFKGVDSVEDAARLKGKSVYVRRSDLNIPEGRFLICDLIGSPVVDSETGKLYGTLEEVMPCPAADVYVVRTEKGAVQVPDVPEFIKKIDNEAIYISPIKGMFE